MAIMLDAGSSLPTVYPDGPGINVAIGAASANSATLVAAATVGSSPVSRVFRLSATGNCRYQVGVGATATATSSYLAAGVVEYIEVRPGDRIAVIQDGTATGNLSITACKIFTRGTGPMPQ